MPTLSKELRRKLENTVAEARRIAEAGSDQSLRQLAVHHFEPWPTLAPEQIALREKLRAHGKQLGDKRDPNRTQELGRLKQACAYEHWHRMLFARFLAENHLLIHPDYGEPLSLGELKELALEQNSDWLSVASSFAQRMLLEVFRPNDSILQVNLPPETRQKLEETLAGLPEEIFTAEDSLGWVYQFWQRDEKEKANKSGDKIGADQLAPVTQLFTEDYMVLFLLHNTLGAWWTAKCQAEGSDPALPGYEWTYLRLNDDGTPAAGTYSGWPKNAGALRVLDPCMGSGHFLTFALPILARIRMVEESLSISEAVKAVLRENLFGLELDARCSQIAAFNLALTAWRLVGVHFPLPSMNLACSGLGINTSEAHWISLAGTNGPARDWMQKLYTLFRQSPLTGSLIDPRHAGGSLFANQFESIRPLLERALSSEHTDLDSEELAIAAKGVVAATHMLTGQYDLVVTNVPFKEAKQLAPALQEHIEQFYNAGRVNLATAFLLRILGFLRPGGSAGAVTPHEWLFLKSYEPTRKQMLTEASWHFLADLGEHAFRSPQAGGAFTALIGISRISPSNTQRYFGIDATKLKKPGEKAEGLLHDASSDYLQSDQVKNPESRIGFLAASNLPLLSNYAGSYVGLQNGDTPRFVFCFWEFPSIQPNWSPFQMPCDELRDFGGRSGLLRWEGGNGVVAKSEMARVQGVEAWGKQGVAIRQTRTLPATRYSGDLFDQSSAVIVPLNQAHLPAIWEYCSSPHFHDDVRKIDKKKNVTNATLVKVPFDLNYWRSIAAERYPGGLPAPYSNDPTQWLFHGHPKDSTRPLHVAVARLLGYRWPRQTGAAFKDCPPLANDGLEQDADSYGIVCLSSIAGEAPAADRLRALLARAYGPSWSAGTLAGLLGKWPSLEDWLRDGFFAEHCELFEHRPFVWHVWDGRKDGFHALLNYHMLAGPNGQGKATLERLIYTSLGDWIGRQRAEVSAGIDGSDARLAAAQHLQMELAKILEGEAAYDIFVRWKPIEEQSIGWAPDLDDGVRLNLRPWLTAGLSPHTKPKKDGCILRVTPRAPYGVDRGKEPPPTEADRERFPWAVGSTERNNDIHLSLDVKRASRERRKK